MPVNRRQARSFYLRCNLFKPKEQEIGLSQTAHDLEWNSDPSYTNVQTYHIQSQEDNVPTIIGRGKGQLAENIDHFTFARDQEIEDGWLIQVLTPSDADDGAWFVTQGSSQDKTAIHRRRTNQRKISALKTATPLQFRAGG